MFRQCKCAPLPVGVLSGLAKYALRSVSQPQPGFCASIWDLVKISYYGVLKKIIQMSKSGYQVSKTEPPVIRIRSIRFCWEITIAPLSCFEDKAQLEPLSCQHDRWAVSTAHSSKDSNNTRWFGLLGVLREFCRLTLWESCSQKWTR